MIGPKKQSDFSEYRALILSELRDLKEGQQELFGLLRAHADAEEVDRRQVQSRLTQLEHDGRWVVRITGVVVAAVSAVCVVLLGQRYL